MSASLTFNPSLTTNVQNSFAPPSGTQGYKQGFAMDDTAARMELSGGVLASTETLVMWGGVPVTELINITGSGSDLLGPSLKRATSQATVTAWSTYNQAHSMLITPGGAVAPAAATGQYVGFFRNGTNIRLAVSCDPALISTIASAGDNVSSLALYWDVTNYRITLTTTGGNFALPASTRLLSVNTNSTIITAGPPPVWAAGDAALILL